LSPEFIAFSMIGSLLALVILGYPVAFVLGGLAAIFGFIYIGPQVSNLFMLRIFGNMGDYILLAIPLFVLMGVIIEKSGLASRLMMLLMLLWVGFVVGWPLRLWLPVQFLQRQLAL